MKKTLKFLFLLVLTLCVITNVNAATISKGTSVVVEDKGTLGHVGGICTNCYWNGYDNQFENGISTRIYSLEGYGYDTYCIDPNLAASSNNMKVQDIITKESTDPYHVGLLAIANLSDKYDKRSVNLAFRMLTISTGNWKNSNSITCSSNDCKAAKNKFRYYASTAAHDMSEYKDIAKKALGSSCNAASCFFGVSKLKDLGLSYEKNIVFPKSYDKVIDEARTLLKEALKAMANKNSGTSSGTTSSMKHLPLLTETDYNNSTVFKQDDYFEISVSNFKKENSIKDLTVNCTNCDSFSNASVKITGYTKDGKDVTADTLNSLTGNAKIIVKVTTQVDRAGYECGDINYNISYKYNLINNSSKNYEVAIIADKSNSTQDFISIIPGDNTSEVSVPLKNSVDFCDGDEKKCLAKDPNKMNPEEKAECCDDWSSACSSDNAYCSYYGNYCAACDTEIKLPSSCDYENGVGKDTTGYVKSAVDDDGNENVKSCLLMRKQDENGNSYEEMSNNYCKVYCKEDFSFNLPGGKSMNSGTFFQLEATVTGTKTCYTTEIDHEKYRQDIAAAGGRDTQKGKEIENEMMQCINMETNYDCFEPEIEYKYEEIYVPESGRTYYEDEYDNMLIQSNKNKLEVVEKIEKEPITTYCAGDIDEQYNCSINAANEWTVNTKYVKSSVTKTYYYKLPSIFYQLRPSGIITMDPSEDAVAVDGLPVSINAGTGRYGYKLTIKNIGEYYDKTTCDSGRIIGDEKSIYETQKQTKNGNNNNYNADYACSYDVNCPDCPVECVGPLCDIELCEGPDCEHECVGNGCAYDNGLTFAYRTVTLNNLNASGRTLGYNWNSDKGEATLKEIESNGEKAYEKAEYSFTLTPALITAIKEYNTSQINNGGYANNTLTCSDDKYGNELVNCESDFIAQIVSGKIGSSNNVVTVPASDEKFVSWLDSDYCNGTCEAIKGSGMGPSWK